MAQQTTLCEDCSIVPGVFCCMMCRSLDGKPMAIFGVGTGSHRMFPTNLNDLEKSMCAMKSCTHPEIKGDSPIVKIKVDCGHEINVHATCICRCDPCRKLLYKHEVVS